MPPQEMRGAWMPTPKKLREASVMMLEATDMVETTMNEGHTLGRMWWKMMDSDEAPMVLDALTNSFSFRRSTSERIRRA